MDVVKLRILTEKSIIGFGKYANLSIGQILALQKTIYLVWIYFNMEGISFNDEILEKYFHFELRKKTSGIDFRIKKPGINPDLYIKYVDVYTDRLHGVEGYILKACHKRRLKANLYSKEKSREIFMFKKSYLQSKNQGL